MRTKAGGVVYWHFRCGWILVYILNFWTFFCPSHWAKVGGVVYRHFRCDCILVCIFFCIFLYFLNFVFAKRTKVGGWRGEFCIWGAAEFSVYILFLVFFYFLNFSCSFCRSGRKFEAWSISYILIFFYLIFLPQTVRGPLAFEVGLISRIYQYYF